MRYLLILEDGSVKGCEEVLVEEYLAADDGYLDIIDMKDHKRYVSDGTWEEIALIKR